MPADYRGPAVSQNEAKARLATLEAQKALMGKPSDVLPNVLPNGDSIDKMIDAIWLSRKYIPAELFEKIKSFFTRENIQIFVTALVLVGVALGEQNPSLAQRHRQCSGHILSPRLLTKTPPLQCEVFGDN
jgi:hypothetical protein